MIDTSIITNGAAMQQAIQQNNMQQLQQLGGNLGQLVLGRRINQMRQLKTPEEQQAFANNSIFSPMLNTQLTADRSAAAKAAADQLKFNADLGKTYAEIGKIGSESGKIGAETGKINTETGITRQNNVGTIWNAYLTGGVNAAKAMLESMKANGTIDDNAYRAELTQLTNVEALPDAAQKQNYALGRYRGTVDPKYSLTTADNVLDNKTAVDNNVRDNTTSENNNVRSTQASIYATDTAAQTADENRALQEKKLEYDKQQQYLQQNKPTGYGVDVNGRKYAILANGRSIYIKDDQGNYVIERGTNGNNPQATAQREEAMRIQRVDTILPEVEKLLPKATGSYAGAGVDFLGNAIGYSTDGAKATAQLKTLSGQLVALMPKMSGPQSDKDVQMYKEMAGELADNTKPVQTRLAALQTISELNNKYRQINNQSGSPLQQNPVPSSNAGSQSSLRSILFE